MEFRYLTACFLARRELQFFNNLISKSKSDKVLQQTKQQTPKRNKLFWSPILQNLNGRSVFLKYSLDEPKKMVSRKK